MSLEHEVPSKIKTNKQSYPSSHQKRTWPAITNWTKKRLVHCWPVALTKKGQHNTTHTQHTTKRQKWLADKERKLSSRKAATRSRPFTFVPRIIRGNPCCKSRCTIVAKKPQFANQSSRMNNPCCIATRTATSKSMHATMKSSICRTIPITCCPCKMSTRMAISTITRTWSSCRSCTR